MDAGATSGVMSASALPRDAEREPSARAVAMRLYREHLRPRLRGLVGALLCAAAVAVLTATLGWMGHPFLDLEVSELADAPPPVPKTPSNQGMLSYKYIPRTGDWGVSDVEYVTLSPPSANVTTSVRQAGTGIVRFHRSTWEQLPTLHHLVNVFAELAVHHVRGGYLVEQRGGSSVAETVRLP